MAPRRPRGPLAPVGAAHRGVDVTIHDLVILARLDCIIRRETRKEKRTCPDCGRPLHYSAADAVFLHEEGRYGC